MAESRNLSIQQIRPQNVPSTDYEYIVVVQMEGSGFHREDAEIQRINDLSLVPKSTGNVSIGAYGHFYHPLYFQLPLGKSLLPINNAFYHFITIISKVLTRNIITYLIDILTFD